MTEDQQLQTYLDKIAATIRNTILATPNPACPHCLSHTRHYDALKQYHPHAGEGSVVGETHI